MRPSDPVRHLTSRRNPRPCSSSRRAADRLALAGDHHRLHPEVAQLLVDLGFAVAAVRGHRPHRPAEQGLDPADRRGQQRRVGRVAQVHAVVEHDPVDVVDDLALVAELHRLPEAALRDRAGVRVVQADQPAGRGRHHPAQPGPGLGDDLPGAAQDELQLGDRRDQPPAGLPTLAGDPASGVDQHLARLARGGLGEIGQLTSDRQHPGLGLVVAQLQVRRDRPSAPPRRPAPVPHRGAAPPHRRCGSAPPAW